jgi:hypothetical protein
MRKHYEFKKYKKYMEEPEIEHIGSYDTNIINIARQIFSKDPQPKHSIKLMIEDKETEQEIFLNIVWFGMKYLFDSDTLPENMTQPQFMLLNNYMASMGKIIVVDTETEEEIKIRIIDF